MDLLSSRLAWSTEREFQDSQGYTEKPLSQTNKQTELKSHPHYYWETGRPVAGGTFGESCIINPDLPGPEICGYVAKSKI